jgi:NAD-specific glutamate dehydrogenase
VKWSFASQRKKDSDSFLFSLHISNQKLPICNENKNESLSFLRWLANDHFTFIGYRAYNLILKKNIKSCHLVTIKGSSLGIFQNENCNLSSLEPIKLNLHLSELAQQPQLLIITKSTIKHSLNPDTGFDSCRTGGPRTNANFY